MTNYRGEGVNPDGWQEWMSYNLQCPFWFDIGLKMSQDGFQEKMDQILSECPASTITIADDTTVPGKSETEDDENLHNLMQVADTKAKTCFQ